MSDVDLIREEANRVFSGLTVFQRRSALKRLLALLDGVTGLAREGDVVLSAETVYYLEMFIRRHPYFDSNECLRLLRVAGVAIPEEIWLASGRPGEEQA